MKEKTDTKIIALKARISQEMYRRVAHATVDRGITIQDAIIEGLLLWLDPAYAGRLAQDWLDDEAQWHRILSEILASEDREVAVRALTWAKTAMESTPRDPGERARFLREQLKRMKKTGEERVG